MTMPRRPKRRASIVFPGISETARFLGYGDTYLITDNDRDLLDRLAAHANLRDGERPAAVTIDPACDAIILYIEGGWLPPTLEMCEGPRIHAIRLEPEIEVDSDRARVVVGYNFDAASPDL